jgi:hypothetical protein
MTTAADITENQVSIGGWASRFGLVCFVAVAFYILSFGPAIKLTLNIKCKGYDRPARFPSLANAVNLAYSPLFGVLGGNEGLVARNALNRYVGLWTYSPELFAVDPKEFQEEVNRSLEVMRKKLKERQKRCQKGVSQ